MSKQKLAVLAFVAVAAIGCGKSSAVHVAPPTTEPVATTTAATTTTVPLTQVPAVPVTQAPATHSPATLPPTTAAQSSALTSPAGNLYRAGEFCPKADLGVTTQGSNGPITCQYVNGRYRWVNA